MGPAAHAIRRGDADNRDAVDSRLPAVLTEIRSLLELPDGAELPDRASLEHTLTSGYAYALGLEQNRVRLERRLAALLRSTGEAPFGELSELTGQLASAERELADVRALLSELREQTFS
jgi:hypothetical protein